jgi:protein-S-isoprenylcysteine O-methyltransferase
MLATFYIPPFEHLFFAAVLPRTDWTKATGVILVILGVVLFAWARRVLRAFYSGHVSVIEGQRLVQSGPYRVIRHPAYAGYFLIALGIVIGYSSLAGLVAILLLLLPGLVYRISVEEKLLLKQFDEEYRTYTLKTKRLIPFIW